MLQKLRPLANSLRTFIKLGILNSWVRHGSFIRVPFSLWFYGDRKDIVLGDRVQFGPRCSIQCDAHFGSSILVGRDVAFVGRQDHRIDIVGSCIWDSGRGTNQLLVIEDDVWIGSGAIILSGITIGRGSVIATGSVVVKDVPRYSIVAGNPARLVKARFTPDQIEEHERLLFRSPASAVHPSHSRQPASEENRLEPRFD